MSGAGRRCNVRAAGLGRARRAFRPCLGNPYGMRKAQRRGTHVGADQGQLKTPDSRQSRSTAVGWIDCAGLKPGDFPASSRVPGSPHLFTRQYARIVDRWARELGLDPAAYGTRSLRRTKASLIYRRTKNLRAVQLPWRHQTGKHRALPEDRGGRRGWRWLSRPRYRLFDDGSDHPTQRSLTGQVATFSRWNWRIESCHSRRCSTPPSTSESCCGKYRGRLGIRNTHWRTGSGGKTWSTRRTAVSAMRRTLQDGDTPRPLHMQTG
jgi:hypothetical protein